MTSLYLPSGSKIGVGYQVHVLANGLTDRGHDVTVFAGSGPSDGARYRTAQVQLPDHLRTFGFAMALRKVDFRGFDVLHAHTDDYWLWRRRAPVHVRTMHGSCLAEAAHIRGGRERVRMLALGASEVLASTVADRTVLVSPQTRRWLPWVDTVIPNGIDCHAFTPGSPDEKAPHPTILFVGTYRNRKRGRFLAEIFHSRIRPRLPDAELIMVCEDAPAAQGVTVTGRISDAELRAWYRRAWVFCLPSTYEGFGIPYVEALCAGLPVVASPNPGAAYVLEGTSAGFVRPDDALGDCLLTLLTDDVLRTRAGAAARQAGLAFSLDGVLDRYEELYRAIGSRRL